MSVETVSSMIHWLGHDGIRIDAGITIYIDPFKIQPGPPADLILITHEHFDHCSPEDIAKILKDDTVIVTEKESAKKLSGDVRVMAPGDSLTVKGIEIEAVRAYNINKKFHPKANNWLGFILTIDGTRVYHAGDTDLIPEMKDIDADIALLPVSGTYVMTAKEAVEAALAINPSLVIPMHYGSIVGDTNDAETFKSGLKGKIDVTVLRKG
ncbi:MAG: MBL fold metallo-hydrolase [Desulfobacteraceae bacterium]|nr:MBL fold metallo-hydrolase [Desulfobacteraceae bacterium]